MSLTFASWNINSINARLHHVKQWLEDNPVDFLFLQELKADEEKFPGQDLEALGYQVFASCQKAYNGVAILVKNGLEVELAHDRLAGDDADDQARFIALHHENMRLINIYLPNGNGEDHKYDYKLGWMKRLKAYANDLLAHDTPFLIGGDFNVIPEERDCYSPAAWQDDALFKLPTRQAYRELVNMGLYDAFRIANDEPHHYTFWDYTSGRWQKDEGIRIDHFLLSPELTDKFKKCEIDRAPRGLEKASDHTPILLEIEA